MPLIRGFKHMFRLKHSLIHRKVHGRPIWQLSVRT